MSCKFGGAGRLYFRNSTTYLPCSCPRVPFSLNPYRKENLGLGCVWNICSYDTRILLV